MNDTELFDFFLTVKKEQGLTTYDVHVHPFDVLGSHAMHHHKGAGGRQKIPPHSLLEKLEYSPLALRILQYVFRFAPRIVRQSIRTNFLEASELRLIAEMSDAAIDRSVLIPVEPFVGAHHIKAHYVSPRFLHVGSLDIHALKKEDIRGAIENQIEHFAIVGLKLHPNIQKFFPEPSRNPADTAEKLREIYNVAKEKKLYILFHGGLSHLLDTTPRTLQYGILPNFFGENDKSELFDTTIPIIIAHVGHYNMQSLNVPLMKIIASTYPHVFFDTSGTGPRLLKEAMEIVGSRRIVFGSDANYFRIKFNAILVLKAIVLARTPETNVEKIANIFGNNFVQFLNKASM